ncbi:hypothetical protein GCM10009544_27360 [Streptomyces stramineus]|uniref:OmpR/PhoB-type domain-containing protein n=1 Tax=Streptomyces stramineus TaxID=173861 RepID=A0ABP3JSS1_9ACTN
MRLRVLGPISARYDGTDLVLGPPRRRALLALLLLRPGRIVPTGLLVEELWGDEPPRHPVATLQTYVSHLRRALDPEGGKAPSVLSYRAPGYVLGIDPEQVDAHRFENLVSAGRRLLDGQDPLAARETFTEALELWHGSPYEEFDSCPSLGDENARLEQIRLTAVESRAEARLALGETSAVTAELTPEVRRYPMRERMVGHLMSALSSLGRQAEALEVYERTRSRLAEEFGVDTDAELQRVHAAVLRQEPPRPAAREQAATSRTAAAPEEGAPAPEEPPTPSPFAGRDHELGRLEAVATSAQGHHGHLAAVLGPAGVGKTRLLLELTARLGTTDLEIVWSHCFPGEGVPPYWLWTQVLRQLAAARPDAFAAATAPFGDLLAPLMPDRLSGQVPGQETGVDWARARFLAHDAVCEVLLTMAAADRRRPLVLLLEDLHWADPASLDLLRLLSTRRQGRPLSIVLTARDTDADGALHHVLAEALSAPRTETLRLAGLSRPAIAALVEAQAGPGVGPDVIGALHERSQGNPYFVIQLLSLFGDVRELHDPDTRDVLLTRVPTGVRETLRRRFATLPEQAVDVLRLCAVIGTDVDTDLLHRVAAPQPVTAALETAIRAGLLSEDPHHPGKVHFTHALAQETLLEDLRHERTRLHARVAEALTARARGQVWGAEVEQLAHHAWQAGHALPADRVLPLLLRAAEQAEQRLAYEQVEAWLRRAVHLVTRLPQDDTTAPLLEQRLHIQLGQVLATTRGYGDAEAEAALARGRALSAVTGAPENASALWALCAAHLVTGRYDDSRRYSGLLRDLADRTQNPVALLGAAYGEGIVLHVRGRLPEALAELEHGVEMADRFARGDGHALARTFQHDPRVSCRSYNAFTHWLLGDTATATARREQLLRLTAYDSRPSDRSFALYVDAVLAALDGDAARAHASGAEGAKVAGEYGLRYWKAMLQLLEGWALAHSGAGEEGLARMHTALAELRPSRTQLRLPLHLGLLGQAQHHVGRRDEAKETLRTMRALIERNREPVYLHPRLPAARLLHRLDGTGLDSTGTEAIGTEAIGTEAIGTEAIGTEAMWEEPAAGRR